MATAKVKKLVERLEQIRNSASSLAASDAKSRDMANLAEEAAGLGLELYDELGKEKK